MVYSYFPVLVNKNPTYKSELDILHFYQVWISVKIQQKNKENPSLIQLGNLGIFPVIWRSSYRPRWLSADIDSNTPTLNRHITDTSSIFHRLPADSICRYIGQYSINMFFDTSFLSRSTFVYITRRYICRHIS